MAYMFALAVFVFAFGIAISSHADNGITRSWSPKNVLRASGVTLFACAALYRRSRVFAIQLGNETGADLGWANRFAFVRIRAITESFCVHDGDHFQRAALSFRMTLRQE